MELSRPSATSSPPAPSGRDDVRTLPSLPQRSKVGRVPIPSKVFGRPGREEVVRRVDRQERGQSDPKTGGVGMALGLGRHRLGGRTGDRNLYSEALRSMSYRGPGTHHRVDGRLLYPVNCLGVSSLVPKDAWFYFHYGERDRGSRPPHVHLDAGRVLCTVFTLHPSLTGPWTRFQRRLLTARGPSAVSRHQRPSTRGGRSPCDPRP